MKSTATKRADLEDRIAAFLEEAEIGPSAPQKQERVGAELLLEVFHYQFEANPAYRNLCRRRGKTPETVHHWRDIPPVAATSFKYVDLFCGDPAEAAAEFHTSGTTTGRPGRHFFRTLRLYRSAALRFFRWAVMPDLNTADILVLGPTLEEFPHSSLGCMFSWIAEEFGGENRAVFFHPGEMDTRGALDWLQGRQSGARPVLILATSLALVSLLDAAEQAQARLALPQGSRVMDTGGSKGRKIRIERKTLAARLQKHFQLGPDEYFNEYGMTELSSQLYETRFTAQQFSPPGHVTPPWLRCVACDPDSLEPLPEGETGVLRFYDLANLDSVAVIQTEDVGTVHGRVVRLQGRHAGAAPRGCSLLAEEILAGP